MKHTICLTRECNLACEYCYVGKRGNSSMSRDVAAGVVDFIFDRTPIDETIHIGFFGGEPLLEFDLLRSITEMVESHPGFDRGRVELAVVTNGTILTPAIADFLLEHDIAFFVSCDGPPAVHDRFRRFPNGTGSSKEVERVLRRAVAGFRHVAVNAVFHPNTLFQLPRVVDYFMALGITQMYLTPDYSASWEPGDIERLQQSFAEVGERYIQAYLRGEPHFISLIDGKITVILRGGYQPNERCRMGTGEFAFTPTGAIFPCERLIGSGGRSPHCIGSLEDGIDPSIMQCHIETGSRFNDECVECGLKDYCMNWCGCSNFFATGSYNRVSAFQCASEKASIAVAFEVYQRLERELGPTFVDHLGGRPMANSLDRHRESLGHG